MKGFMRQFEAFSEASTDICVWHFVKQGTKNGCMERTINISMLLQAQGFGNKQYNPLQADDWKVPSPPPHKSGDNLWVSKEAF
jgi:hypothetical protein